MPIIEQGIDWIGVAYSGRDSGERIDIDAMRNEAQSISVGALECCAGQREIRAERSGHFGQGVGKPIHRATFCVGIIGSWDLKQEICPRDAMRSRVRQRESPRR